MELLKLLPGTNCVTGLWQNKNGQVYSHGIIVLALWKMAES